MRSYLRFLRRNRLYTAIEVVGLSVALAFVIVLAAYIVDDMSVNKALKDTDDIYLCHCGNDIFSEKEIPDVCNSIPDVEDICTVITSAGNKLLFTGVTRATYADKEFQVATIAASANFFDFFTFPLSEGNPEEVLMQKNSVLISEEVARVFFPEGDAIGKTINVYENNSYTGAFPGRNFSDLDIDLTVTGVFSKFPKTIFKEADIIINIDMYHEQQENMFQGMMYLQEFHFLRLNEAGSSDDVSKQLNGSLNNIVLTRFDQIKKLGADAFPNLESYFTNIRNGKLFGIYMIMCIFLTIVALLDYVVLTIAFSRFRIKEIATRQLLGTGRTGVIGRCFAEAFALLIVSCGFAVLIALAFKTPVGQILGMEIHPLSHAAEYVILLCIILVMVALASAVPSIILSSYSAINVIKGEARYKDKIIFGKIFIGLAGVLSIGALSICFGITRQTRHLINQPSGYHTDGVILVRFADKEMDRYRDELEAQPYVSRTGSFSNEPSHPSATMILDKFGEQKGELRFIDGDRDYFEILGVEFHEDYFVADSDQKIYLCKGTYEATAGFRDGNMLDTWMGRLPVCGIVSDLKLGNVTEETSGKLMGISIIDGFDATIGEQICVKTEENVNDVCRRIKEFYYSKGYNDDVLNVTGLKEFIEVEIKEEKNMLTLLAGFSVICILMTIMTIVGLSSYHAKTGEKDNVVRNVFGCSKGEIVRKMVLDFTLPVIISAALAIPASYIAIGQWLEGYVIRTENSPVIYIGAFALVLAVVTASILLQFLRTLRTNPADALKKE